jgi:chromosome segregation ATPase
VTARAAAAALLGALATGCGSGPTVESAEADFCAAREEVASSVSQLADLELAETSLDDLRSELEALREDLQRLGGAIEVLAAARGDELADAVDELRESLDELGADTTLAGAAARFREHGDELSDAWSSLVAAVEC